MENVQWEKLKAATDKFLKAEKYINKPYEGILEAIYPHETDSGQQVINLDFKGGSSLSLFGASYRNEDGSYPMGLGDFIKSCEALGVEFQGAYMDDILTGVRLVKDNQEINNPKISIRGISNKKVGDDKQTIEKFGWGILEKIETSTSNKTQGTTTTTTSKPKGKSEGFPDETVIAGAIEQCKKQGISDAEGIAAVVLYWSGSDAVQARRCLSSVVTSLVPGTTQGKSRGKLPTTTTKEPESPIGNLKGAWEDALMTLLQKEPLSEKDCQLQLKNVVTDAKVRKAMSDYRAQNNLFKTFKDEGFLEQGDDGKYQVAV